MTNFKEIELLIFKIMVEKKASEDGKPCNCPQSEIAHNFSCA